MALKKKKFICKTQKYLKAYEGLFHFPQKL